MADETITAPAKLTGDANLPTYRTVADFLEKKNGSGLRLVGWTLARSLMITPPLLAVGIPLKKAIAGGLLSSGLISLFTMMRIYNAGFEKEWELRRRRTAERRRAFTASSSTDGGRRVAGRLVRSRSR